MCVFCVLPFLLPWPMGSTKWQLQYPYAYTFYIELYIDSLSVFGRYFIKYLLCLAKIYRIKLYILCCIFIWKSMNGIFGIYIWWCVLLNIYIIRLLFFLGGKNVVNVCGTPWGRLYNIILYIIFLLAVKMALNICE